MASFYIDNDVPLAVAHLLRDAGHDAVTALDLALESAPDDEHLLIAAQQDRAFVTHNGGDFILLHDAWHRWSAAWEVSTVHAGILIVPQGRKYGTDWDARGITRALIDSLQHCSPLEDGLFQRRQAGWERRVGRTWTPCQ